MGETLRGTVTRTYHSDARFSAGVLTTDAGETVRFRGKFYAAQGDRLAMVGHWMVDPTYGHQFEVTELNYDLPQTRAGLAHYLATHPAFEGIGAKTAERIVAVLDEGQSLEAVLRDSPGVLTSVGIPHKTVAALTEAWTQHVADHSVRTYLAGFGLTHHQVQTLLDKQGGSVVSMLKNDPYLLLGHLPGYGFNRMDQIALKMGVAKTHPGRIEAALAHCLSEQIGGGHTWTSGSDLVRLANDVLIIDDLSSREMIQAAGHRMIARGDFVVEGSAVTRRGLYDDEQLIQRTFATEAWAAPSDVLTVEPIATLSQDQQHAYQNALTRRISVISGGAGVGKTYVVAHLAKTLREAGRTVCLCAPTGKAAKRIEQLLAQHEVQLTAVTMHRLLGYNGMAFEADTIDADVVIVDEMSMVDVRLMAELLRHLDFERTQLILVGDHNQLPPVGPGNVLRDVIEHRLAPVTILTRVHRQAGVLKANSVAVLDGTVAPGATDARSRWIVVDKFKDAASIKIWLRDLMLDELPGRLGFDPVRDVQIITPEHRGELGTRSLNEMMQRLVRPAPSGGGKRSRLLAGDKVIQTRNDYELGAMNGTIGLVEDIGKDGLAVAFEGMGRVEVPWNKASSIDLAYALTAHKAQGSEFPCVVVLCHKSHYFADRNWLYTAVTRAAHTCVLIGDAYGLRRAARQVRNLNRRTLLSLWATRSRSSAQETAA